MITTSADADKISAIETEHYISERAKRDRKDAFKNVLNRILGIFYIVFVCSSPFRVFLSRDDIITHPILSPYQAPDTSPIIRMRARALPLQETLSRWKTPIHPIL